MRRRTVTGLLQSSEKKTIPRSLMDGQRELREGGQAVARTLLHRQGEQGSPLPGHSDS